MPRRPAPTRRLITTLSWPLGVALTSWDYMWRSTPLHRREVIERDTDGHLPPSLPGEADRADVIGVADGHGPLFHRRYSTRIRDAKLGPEELFATVAANLNRAAPTKFARFQRVFGDQGTMSLGDEYVVRMPGPWDGPVRVIALDERSFRFATLAVHLEAGQIEFRVGEGEPLAFVIELLAAIPSIIYGLWGFRILAPIMRAVVEPFLKNSLGKVPVVGALFSGPAVGRDLLVAGVILAIMILPTITTVSREILRAVPNTQREGMLALGATRWETIQRAVLPYAKGGIAGATILGLGRALGETMAVTMVIGNSTTQIRPSLFTPGYTLASAIANQFTEADKAIYFSAIVEIALVLLLVAGVMNVLARLVVWRVARGPLPSVARAG